VLDVQLVEDLVLAELNHLRVLIKDHHLI
jgi:hypothetical protein